MVGGAGEACMGGLADEGTVSAPEYTFTTDCFIYYE